MICFQEVDITLQHINFRSSDSIIELNQTTNQQNGSVKLSLRSLKKFSVVTSEEKLVKEKIWNKALLLVVSDES